MIQLHQKKITWENFDTILNNHYSSKDFVVQTLTLDFCGIILEMNNLSEGDT